MVSFFRKQTMMAWTKVMFVSSRDTEFDKRQWRHWLLRQREWLFVYRISYWSTVTWTWHQMTFWGWMNGCVLISPYSSVLDSEGTTREPGKYHCCWCPGAMCRQVISSHGFDYVREWLFVYQEEEFQLPVLMISLWRNNIKQKYISISWKKRSARQV